MLDLLNNLRFVEPKRDTVEKPVEKLRKKHAINPYIGPWTEEELATLHEVYPIMDRHGILAALPRRTWEAIKNRARKEGLNMDPTKVNYKGSVNRWSEDEFNLMRWFWPKAPEAVMTALLPDRTIEAMITKAHQLGLNRKLGAVITSKEAEIIMQINDLGKVETMRLLPNHTWKQVTCFARDKLNIELNVLPKKDMDLLAEMVAQSYTNRDIETMLDIAPQVRGRALKALGVER